jgi:protein-tyrosine phosphatase
MEPIENTLKQLKVDAIEVYNYGNQIAVTNAYVSIGRLIVDIETNESKALDRIAELMGGSEYDLENLDAIVDVLRATGRYVSEIES